MIPSNPNLKFASNLIPLDPNKVEYIFIHHPMAVTATIYDIHKWHLDNGWAGAGYNEYIRKNGMVEIMRGDHIGAQTANYNSKSYGICCEGNYEVEQKMPEAQFKSLIERIKFHVARFPKKPQVLPHDAFLKTACPGKFFPMLEVYAALEEKPEHWAEKPYKKLIDSGYVIHEKRFDDKITRGEVFALLAQERK